MSELVILIGLQGAGKTTFYTQRFAATHVLISKDLLRSRPSGREPLRSGGVVARMDNEPRPRTSVRLVVRALLPPFLAAVVFLGPTVAALASRPRGAVLFRPPQEVIRVHPFRGEPDCFSGPRAVRVGPFAQEGRLWAPAALWSRVTSSVARCADDEWQGHVTVRATVDAEGKIVDTRALGDDPEMNACVRAQVVREGRVETRGPGTLAVGYFRGDERY